MSKILFGTVPYHWWGGTGGRGPAAAIIWPILPVPNASIKVLENAPWIMQEKGSGTREHSKLPWMQKESDIRNARELGHTEAIKKAVEAGLGVGCLSRMAVQREWDNDWLVKTSPPLNLRRTLIILTRESGYRSKVLNACLPLLGKNKKTREVKVPPLS
jgi:DNA-binding transcriptional LysR family regulator